MSPRPRRRVGPLGVGDMVLVAALALSLAASCVLASSSKFLWYDELVSRLLVTDPSFTHMLGTMGRGGEAAPPLYHVLARLWAALFGAGTLSLRLFSSVTLSAAAGVYWCVLRRAFTLRATALGLLTVFGTSSVLLWQNAETRFYGVFVLASSLAVLATVLLMERDRPSRRLLLATFAAHAALLWCHYFGLLYSGALAALILVRDIRRRAFRLPVYASVAGAWATFVLWLVPLARQAEAAGKSWIARPGIAALIDVYQFGMPWLGFAMLVAVLLPSAERSLGGGAAPDPRSAQTAEDVQSTFVLLAIALLLVPIVPFVVSRVWEPVFLDRYLLPTAPAWAIVIAMAVDALAAFDTGSAPAAERAARPPRVARRAVVAAWVLVFATLLAYPPFYGRRVVPVHRPIAVHPWKAIEDARLDGAPLRAIPIAVEFANDFLPLYYYSRRPDLPAYFIADSLTAFDPAADGTAQLQYKGMLFTSRRGYFPGRIVSSASFLCAHDRFVVIDEPRHLWYERRVAADSAFATRTIGSYGKEGALRHVERRRPLDSAECGPTTRNAR